MSQTANSDDLVDAGEALHKAGRLLEAESHYRNALAIDPGHPGALFYLANIAYEDGRLQFARELTEELLSGEPNDAEAWYLSGIIALKEDNPARAIECFGTALAAHPSYTHAYYSLGKTLFEQNDFDAALVHFQQAVKLDPAFAEAHYSIGRIFQAQNEFERALFNYYRAIGVKSNFSLAYESIGDILLSQGKLSEAITIFNKAIAENSGTASILTALGAIHLSQNQNAIAADCFERAIALDPRNFAAHFNLGNALFKQSKIHAAIISFRRAETLNPQDTRLLQNLATALYSHGETDKSADIYRRWLAQEPDNPIARHHLAACSRESVPARADNAYVEHTFDAFAETFDATLGGIDYQGPQLIAAALQREFGAGRKQFAVLDAGCGTGLCGPLVTAYAAQLTGADLSAGMLAKAKLRNVYDELIKTELTAYLQSQVNSFDIILSADTLIYFGELDKLFAASRSAIRNGGYLFVTAEAFIENRADNKPALGYHLNPHGRYSHTEAYLKKTLSDAGFSIIAMRTAILRYEHGHPVKGFVASCCAVSNG
jgi:predicted TPR repeat methyltransferase